MDNTTAAKTPGMPIGVLADSAGVKVETIRYYESVGILAEPPRSPGGHRIYGAEQVRRLSFVRRARELGFSLGDVRLFLDLVDGGGKTCAEVRDVTLAHLGGVRAKIADLQRLEKTLAETVAACDGNTVPDCPVVDALFGPN